MRFPSVFHIESYGPAQSIVIRDGRTLTSPDKAEKGTMLIDCPASKVLDGIRAWVGGKFIQDALPFLTAGEREFIMTGTTPQKWNEMFGEKE